jgi:hypothetical protein
LPQGYPGRAFGAFPGSMLGFDKLGLSYALTLGCSGYWYALAVKA